MSIDNLYVILASRKDTKRNGSECKMEKFFACEEVKIDTFPMPQLQGKGCTTYQIERLQQTANGKKIPQHGKKNW